MNLVSCPVCGEQSRDLLKQTGQYFYYKCASCSVIFLSPDMLAGIDNGESLILYNDSYWKNELKASKERSRGSSLARVAEVILYARRPIKKFIDIASGPGFLLDSISYYLPSSAGIFYANELFPPTENERTHNRNYRQGNPSDFGFSFDAGCCIEVIEHLTPSMLRQMFIDLAFVSERNSIYIFNTGLSEFIEKENMNYLDPHRRGHIMGWSIKGLQHLLHPVGFDILPIPGKRWAFLAEYMPDHSFGDTVTGRIWHPLPENVEILKDKKSGDIMYVLGLETARAYA